MDFEQVVVEILAGAGGEMSHASLVDRLYNERRQDVIDSLHRIAGRVERTVIQTVAEVTPVLVYRLR